MTLTALEKRRKWAKRTHGTLGQKRQREIRHAVAETHQGFVAAASESRRRRRKALAILVAAAIIGVPVSLLMIFPLKNIRRFIRVSSLSSLELHFPLGGLAAEH